MVRERKKGVGAEASRSAGSTGSNPAKNQDAARRFTWEIASISMHLEEIRYFWAKTLGISGPQWMILMALADLDKGEGASVKAVAKLLNVDSSFVTTQSKIIEKKGLVRRRTSEDDARVVQMSLTERLTSTWRVWPLSRIA
jgi:MarR family transcriptional regulator, organic hydroperoxide resistance regulator